MNHLLAAVCVQSLIYLILFLFIRKLIENHKVKLKIYWVMLTLFVLGILSSISIFIIAT